MKKSWARSLHTCASPMSSRPCKSVSSRKPTKETPIASYRLAEALPRNAKEDLIVSFICIHFRYLPLPESKVAVNVAKMVGTQVTDVNSHQAVSLQASKVSRNIQLYPQ